MRTPIRLRSRIAAILVLFAFGGPAIVALAEERKLDLEKDKAYEHVIAPILANRCTGCHGEKKAKGKLRMHTPEAIKAGADEEPILVPGKSGESEMFSRIMLPDDDEDVMPPEDKERLTAEQKKLIAWWIDQGASFDKKVSELQAPDDIKTILIAVVVAPQKAAQAAAISDPFAGLPKPSTIDPAALKPIEDAGVLIMQVSQDSPFLSANVVNVAKDFGDDKVNHFASTAANLVWLDVSKSKLTDAAAPAIGRLQNLTRLHLEKTAITDAALPEIGKLQHLQYLNLYGTKVTDAGLDHLKGLKNLKKVFLWQTGVTEAGAKKLKAAIPGIDVNLGWKEPAKPEEKKAAASGKPGLYPKLVVLCDDGSCCHKAHAKNETCAHPCCVKAFAANKVCLKCNPKAKDKLAAFLKNNKT